ncbi:MAG: hypothetical protein QW197_01690 [Candidatus Aenigmatarchaeota archaeon]
MVNEIKIRINVFLVAFILAIVITSVAIYYSITKYKEQEVQKYYYNYKGYNIEFRKPIEQSKNILVLPNESVLNISTYALALGAFKNFTIVIFENDNNEVTAMGAFELASKIVNILNYELSKLGYDKIQINVLKIKKDISELNISKREYYVFLKSYLISNETYIKVHSLNFVEIAGKNIDEFDYAIIKFIVTFLNNMKAIYK